MTKSKRKASIKGRQNKSKRAAAATRKSKRATKRSKRATKRSKRVKNVQRGGGGLFGESQGTCGWGNHPSCCFTSCAPMWRTSLWPISDMTM